MIEMSLKTVIVLILVIIAVIIGIIVLSYILGYSPANVCLTLLSKVQLVEKLTGICHVFGGWYG